MKKLLIVLLSLSAGTLVYLTGETGIVRNYFPDLFWGIAVLLTATWMEEENFQQGFIYSLIALPVITEVGQLGIFPGTFDIYDMTIYVFLLLVFFHVQIKHVCKRIVKHY
jgi:hypothetical protein